MHRFGPLAFVLWCAGCLAPLNLVQVPGSGARVSASEEIRQLVERYEPAVIALLGTRWEWPYVIVETKRDIGYWAYTRNWDRRVVIYNPQPHPTALQATVMHELAHVHMRGQWRALPPVLQEGVANWVARKLLGIPIVMEEPPTPEQRRRALTMTNKEYLTLDDAKEIDRVAMKMAAELF